MDRVKGQCASRTQQDRLDIHAHPHTGTLHRTASFNLTWPPHPSPFSHLHGVCHEPVLINGNWCTRSSSSHHYPLNWPGRPCLNKGFITVRTLLTAIWQICGHDGHRTANGDCSDGFCGFIHERRFLHTFAIKGEDKRWRHIQRVQTLHAWKHTMVLLKCATKTQSSVYLLKLLMCDPSTGAS